MSSQGSAKISVLIDARQRVRRIDNMLDQLLKERRALIDTCTELDVLCLTEPNLYPHKLLVTVDPLPE